AEHDPAALLPRDRRAVARVRGVAARADQVRPAVGDAGHENEAGGLERDLAAVAGDRRVAGRPADAAGGPPRAPGVEVADEDVRDEVLVAGCQVAGCRLEGDAARLAVHRTVE